MNSNILRVPVELVSRVETESQSAIYRNDFMRDRDRIMYCSAFRRLDGKTQIYLTGKNDHRRNRLTHTLEVAQIARTIAQALGLDINLTEAIALGHDLGHTPFGHAGERILNTIMQPGTDIKIPKSPFYEKSRDLEGLEKPILGFKHNIQSVRVAAFLENGHGDNGLNLTNYTLWGMLHHSKLEYNDGQQPNYQRAFDKQLMTLNTKETRSEAWSFEALVVAQSDEIAQWHHDLEDAFRSKAMSPRTICALIKETLWTIMSAEDKKFLQEIQEFSEGENYNQKKFITLASRIVVNTLVTRIVQCSEENLLRLAKDNRVNENNRIYFFTFNKWDNAQIKGAIGFDLIGYDLYDEACMTNKLKKFPDAIKTEIHHSQEVERMNAKGTYIIKKLFEAYYTHPQQLPDMSIARFMIEVYKILNIQEGYWNYKNMESIHRISFGIVRSEFEALWKKYQNDFDAQACLMRTICDHIASMTDRYATEEYEKLYG